jgi:hypothetical protein
MEGMILKYASDPEVVEAIVVSVLTSRFAAAWCGGSVVTEVDGLGQEQLGVNVPTPDARNLRARANGDYIVKLSDGTFTVFEQSMFRKKYPHLIVG